MQKLSDSGDALEHRVFRAATSLSFLFSKRVHCCDLISSIANRALSPIMHLTNIRPHGWILAYGMLIFLMLPGGVTAMSDDFGYLGSVVETLRHNRPWTDDWLEPWSASLSALTAILYKASGSFQLATQGLQTTCAIAACAGAYALCHSRGLSRGASLTISILGLTYPTLLWNSIDFTGMILYTPCLFWAIWAAEKRRWGVFYIVWAIAFASRQSAITWLILPMSEVVIRFLRPAKVKIASSHPALVLWGAIIAYLVLSFGMNHTQSQKVITQHLVENVRFATAIQNFAIMLGIFAISSGLAALILSWRTAGLPVARNIPRRVFVLLVLGVGIFTFVKSFPSLFGEHQNFESRSGLLYSNILVAAGLGGWLLLRFTIRWELLLASLAAGLLVSLRRDVWDYYYADVAIFSFFSVLPPLKTDSEETFSRLPRAGGIACVLVLSAFHLWFVFEQKCRVDRDYAVAVITERALRANEIDVCDIGYAPFGFIGWRLHRHFVEHDGQNDPDIGGFMRYQRSGAAEKSFSPLRFWRDSKSLRPFVGEQAARVIWSEVFRVGWLWNQRVTILRAISQDHIQPSRLVFDRSEYQPRPFPLTNQEWREYIESL